jgi:glucose/arabinose dehydrogenase
MSDTAYRGSPLGLLDSVLAYIYKPLQPLIRGRSMRRVESRRWLAEDILLPEGYVAEVVTTGLNAPVHCTFAPDGSCYVVECGHKIESRPRVLRVDTATGATSVLYEFSDEEWSKTGAVTGAAWHDGALYVSNTDRILRLSLGGKAEEVLTGLPGLGDHHTNHPLVGPDGKLYWGQGTATNAGIVGADNFAYEWLPHFPEFHDVPGADVELVGRNYAYRNVLGSLTEQVRSGAYVPFGTETTPGQVISGSTACNGAIMRCNPDGSGLETVAWGLRNPYGIAFAPDGRLFATEHGIDERGERFIAGDLEDFYEIHEGGWYGWPDFASGIRLDDPRWGGTDTGRGREPVLAHHPDPEPPRPFATFPPHAAPNGFDFSRDPAFGFEGDAFVALYGDVAPLTARPSAPAGFKVVRIDMARGEVVDFAVNKISGPASKLPHSGFERPSHCQFGPDGSLYVVDWGQIDIAPETGGIRMPLRSGALWRIRRTAGPAGTGPPRPRELPLYLLQALGAALACAAALAAAGVAVRLLRRVAAAKADR